MRLHKIDGRLQVIFIMKSNSIGYRKRSWYLPFLSENTWQTHQQFSFLWNGIKHYSLSRSKAAAKVMIVKWDERIVSITMSNTLSDSARRNIRNRFGCYHQPKLSGEKWRRICFKRKIWPDYSHGQILSYWIWLDTYEACTSKAKSAILDGKSKNKQVWWMKVSGV